jgi:hypothetical protein
VIEEPIADLTLHETQYSDSVFHATSYAKNWLEVAADDEIWHDIYHEVDDGTG